jgi:septal ring factor EnvC (AmiA/AmiB activator)
MKDKPQGYAHLTAEIDSLERELAAAQAERDKLAAALKEQRTQMDYPELPPAFAETMKRMIDAAMKECGK